jgi:hypothetical protein
LVGHYRCAGTQVPVIDGVIIHPDDLISADSEGVVIAPRDRPAYILNLARQLDFNEHSIYPLIEKTKSIEDAVKQFGRLQDGETGAWPAISNGACPDLSLQCETNSRRAPSKRSTSSTVL